jgi:hypothetical protein
VDLDTMTAVGLQKKDPLHKQNMMWVTAVASPSVHRPVKYDVILVISAAAVRVSLADQVRKGTVLPLIFAAVAPRKPRGVGDLTARRDLIPLL